VADTPKNEMNVSLSGVLDFLNPFSDGFFGYSGNSRVLDYRPTVDVTQLKAENATSLLKNAFNTIGWNGYSIWAAKSPLSETQITAIGQTHEADMIRAGATREQARLSRYDVEKYAQNINAGNYDKSVVGQLDAVLPDLPSLPDKMNLSSFVLVALLGVAALVIYSEVK
jgi:hypothetical protein